jgi:predicted ester cyclase
MLSTVDTSTANKALVRRLIEEVLNHGRLDILDELYTARMARAARHRIEPFLIAFPDVRMEIVELVAEDDKVIGRFRYSGTHRGPWRGQPATGRRSAEIHDGRIARSWGLEDTHSRLKQLGLSE